MKTKNVLFKHFMLKIPLFAFFILSLIIGSCKKSDNNDQEKLNPIEAKEWLIKQQLGPDFDVDWSKSQELISNGKEIIVLPLPNLEYNGKIITYSSLLIYKDENGLMVGNKLFYTPNNSPVPVDSLIKILDDNERPAESYNGNILLYSLKGKFIKRHIDPTGNAYTRSVKTPKRQQTGSANGGKVSVYDYELAMLDYYPVPGGPTTSPALPCYDFFQVITIDRQVIQIIFMGRRCTVVGIMSMDIDGGPQDPISKVGGGEISPNGGLAGKEIKTDSLKKKYPCVIKKIFGKLDSLEGYSNLLQPFYIPGKRPTLTWDAKNISGWGMGGVYNCGETRIASKSGLGASSDITLNKWMIDQASEIIVAATVIHETYHAYSNYSIAYAIDPSTNPYSPNYLAGFYDRMVLVDLNSSQNYAQHLVMMTSQFDNMVNLLRAYSNNTYSVKDCAMAMAVGMNNPGSGASAPKVTFLNNVYSSLLTKYGISTADMNTFQTANMNAPANKRVPTGCVIL